jgi:hypothetical protein
MECPALLCAEVTFSRGRQHLIFAFSILRMRGDGCFKRTANDSRRYRLSDAPYVRVARWNLSSAIPSQEYKWDIAVRQSIGDLEAHFARELKIERHAVQARISDYIECGIHGPHRLDNLDSLGGHRICEVLSE